MPPMVCFGYTGDDGMVSDKSVHHYEARARGGVGIIVVEATCVSKDGRLANSQLGIWSDDHIAGLSRIAGVCHQYGAAVLIQIHHAGHKSALAVNAQPSAPSDYHNGNVNARAMTIDELTEIQQDFVDAACRAQKAGFDGVELHGAHGYLISQFMSPSTNLRTDQYGGSSANRMRFGLEIVERIRVACGPDFIVSCRMGGNEPTIDDGIIIAKELERCGANLLHVSAGIGSGTDPAVPDGFAFSWIVYAGSCIKQNVSVPVIVVSGIRTPQQAEAVLAAGLGDFVAVGKGLLVDAEWANKAREQREVITCLSCKKCRWFVDGRHCPRMKQAEKNKSGAVI